MLINDMIKDSSPGRDPIVNAAENILYRREQKDITLPKENFCVKYRIQCCILVLNLACLIVCIVIVLYCNGNCIVIVFF